MEALGYTLRKDNNAFRQGWLAKVFIANARNTLSFAGCVPHWTIKEFFTELRNLFGMLVFVNGKEASIVARSTVYSNGQYIELHNPADERSTDIDTDGEQKDTTSGNVGYDFTDIVDKQLSIGEDTYGKLDIRHVDDADIVTAFQALSDEAKAKSNILFITNQSKLRYGIFHSSETGRYTLEEVDHMGPLLRDDDYKVDTALKIVPVAMAEDIVTERWRLERAKEEMGKVFYNNSIYPVDPTDPKDGGEHLGFHVPYMLTADTRAAATSDKFNLQTFIETDEDTSTEENEKQEVMEVAVNDDYFKYKGSYILHPVWNKTSKDVALPYPIGIPYRRSRFTDKIAQDTHSIYFILNLSGSPSNVLLNGGNLDIDTRITRQISFTDNATDPTKIYLINGRKYLCQKIEVTLGDDGVQPLKKGYFYEIE